MGEGKHGSGSCLCGAVRFSTSDMGQKIGACHCKMCRKWGGGPFMEVDCGQNIRFEGSENIRVYDSSEWADRGFCGNCGTHLFFRLKAGQQHMVPVGLFDETEGVVFEHQVFIDEKPDYYSFVEETRNMTGAELFAKYSPQ